MSTTSFGEERGYERLCPPRGRLTERQSTFEKAAGRVRGQHMKMTLEEVAAKVASQKELLPSLYGDVDFSNTPQRFTDDFRDESSLRGEHVGKRAEILSDREQV